MRATEYPAGTGVLGSSLGRAVNLSEHRSRAEELVNSKVFVANGGDGTGSYDGGLVADVATGQGAVEDAPRWRASAQAAVVNRLGARARAASAPCLPGSSPVLFGVRGFGQRRQVAWLGVRGLAD